MPRTARNRTVLDELRREWAQLLATPAAARLAELAPELFDPAGARMDPDVENERLNALLDLAATDPLAVRAALQILLPRLINLAARTTLQVGGRSSSRPAIADDDVASAVLTAAWSALAAWPATWSRRCIAGRVLTYSHRQATYLLPPQARHWRYRLAPEAQPDHIPVAVTAAPEDLTEPVPLTRNASDELLDIIVTAVAGGNLDTDQATLLVRSVVLDATYEQIGDRTGHSARTVRRHAAAANRALLTAGLAA